MSCCKLSHCNPFSLILLCSGLLCYFTSCCVQIHTFHSFFFYLSPRKVFCLFCSPLRDFQCFVELCSTPFSPVMFCSMLPYFYSLDFLWFTLVVFWFVLLCFLCSILFRSVDSFGCVLVKRLLHVNTRSVFCILMLCWVLICCVLFSRATFWTSMMSLFRCVILCFVLMFFCDIFFESVFISIKFCSILFCVPCFCYVQFCSCLHTILINSVPLWLNSALLLLTLLCYNLVYHALFRSALFWFVVLCPVLFFSNLLIRYVLAAWYITVRHDPV